MFWKKNPAPPQTPPPTPPAAAPEEAAARASETLASSETAPPENGGAAGVADTAAATDPGAADASASPHEEIASGLLREQIIGQLRTVYDPEIPVNIYELGLVYKVHVDEERHVLIEMTLTSPACPSAEEIPVDVKRKAEALEGVKSVEVRIVWDPPWSQEFMSEAAKVQLGFF